MKRVDDGSVRHARLPDGVRWVICDDFIVVAPDASETTIEHAREAARRLRMLRE